MNLGVPLNLRSFPNLTSVKCSCCIFGGADVGDSGKNQFRLYLELDSSILRLPIVNFDYLRHSRLIGEGFRAIRALLSSFLIQISSSGL